MKKNIVHQQRPKKYRESGSQTSTHILTALLCSSNGEKRQGLTHAYNQDDQNKGAELQHIREHSSKRFRQDTRQRASLEIRERGSESVSVTNLRSHQY